MRSYYDKRNLHIALYMRLHYAIATVCIGVQETPKRHRQSRRYCGTIKDPAALTRVRANESRSSSAVANHRFASLGFPIGHHTTTPPPPTIQSHKYRARALPALRFHSITSDRTSETLRRTAVWKCETYVKKFIISVGRKVFLGA